MNKIVILGDTHIGMRNDSVAFIEHQKNFYSNVLIPYCIDNKVKHIIQVGDLFDRRQSVNFRSLHHAKQYLFDELQKLGIQLHVLIGNHDSFYLDSIDINSPELLLGEYDNIHICQEPRTITLNSVQFDLIPWICKSNETEVMDFISKSHSDYCLGHLELANFPMYRGIVSEHGMSPDIFKKYTKVWSGHYHTRSAAGNIEYIGTPMEITWQDWNDPRGFTVFDTKELTQEFIENPHTIFEKIEYDEETFNHKSFNYAGLKNKYIKIIVVNKITAAKYDSFLQKVNEAGAHDIAIVESFQEFTTGEVDDDIELEDTLTVVNSYIDSVDTNADKQKLKNLMQSLYVKAINGDI